VLRTLAEAARTFVCQEAPTRPAVVSQWGRRGAPRRPLVLLGRTSSGPGGEGGRGVREPCTPFSATVGGNAFRSKRVGIAASSSSGGTNRKASAGRAASAYRRACSNSMGPAREHGMLSRSGMRGVEGVPERRSWDPGWRAIAWRRLYDFCLSTLSGRRGGSSRW